MDVLLTYMSMTMTAFGEDIDPGGRNESKLSDYGGKFWTNMRITLFYTAIYTTNVHIRVD